MIKKLLLYFIIFTNFQVLSQNYIPYRKGKLWGVCDSLGKIIIQPQFDNVEFEGSNMLITKKNGLLGAIVKGKFQIPNLYSYVYYHDWVIEARNNSKINYYNSKGKIILGDSLYLYKFLPRTLSYNQFEEKLTVKPEFVNNILTQMVGKKFYYLYVFNTKTELFSKPLLKSEDPIVIHYETIDIKKRCIAVINNKYDPQIKEILYNVKTKGFEIKEFTKDELIAIKQTEFYINLNEFTRLSGKVKSKNSYSGALGSPRGNGDGLNYKHSNGSGPGSFDNTKIKKQDLEEYQIYHKFVIQDGVIKDSFYMPNNKKLTLTDKDLENLKSNLDFKFDEIKFVELTYHYNGVEKDDYKVIKKNAFFFKQNNKWGLQLYNYQYRPQWDTIILKDINLYEYFSVKRTVENAKNYGIVNVSSGKELSCIYDSIPSQNTILNYAFLNNKLFLFNDDYNIIGSPLDSIKTIVYSNQYATSCFSGFIGKSKNFIRLGRGGNINLWSSFIQTNYKLGKPIVINNKILLTYYNHNNEFMGYASTSGVMYFSD